MSNIIVDFATYQSDTTTNGPYNSGDTVTLADTSTILDALSDSDIDGLATNNVDVISATDSVLTWNADQFSHLTAGPITIDSNDVAILADTGATIGGLTTLQIHQAAIAGLDVLDATDDVVTLSVAQFAQAVSDNVALTAGDTVTISDTASNISGLSFSALAAANVDFLDSTDVFTTLTGAQLSALGIVAFTTASAVTLTDTGANIAAVSNFSTFSAHGVDTLDASDDTLTISEAQFQALGTTTLTGADTVTISDTGNNIVGGPNYGTLGAAGIDLLNATTAINITINDITNLGVVIFTSGSAVTLSDTGAHIAAVGNFATFGTHGVDRIDATNNTLTMSVTQFGALGSVTLTAGDTVTISDTATRLSTLTFSALGPAEVDFLNSTNAYTLLSVAQLTALGTVHFTSASNVTLTDTALNIQAVADFSTFATHGIDTIDSNDDALSLTAAQYTGLGTTHLTGADAVTLADTGAQIATLTPTQLSQLGSNGIDFVNPTDDTLPISLAQFNAFNVALLTPPVVITLTDTSATIDGLSTSDINTLATGGINAFNATDDVLSLSLAQYEQMVTGGIALTAGDDVTVTGNLDGLSTVEIASFATNHVDHLLDVDGFNEVIWNVAQWDALTTAVTNDNAAHIAFLNVVFDSGANLDALTPTQIANFVTEGAEVFEGQPPGQETVTWNVAKLQAMGSAIWQSTTVIISDTGANLEAVSDYTTFAGHGVTTISASDGSLSLTASQFSDLGSTNVDSANTLTLADTAANIEAMGTDGYTAIAAQGVDFIHATDGSLIVTFDELSAILTSSTVFASADHVTLTGSQVDLFDSQNATFFSSLGPIGIDEISLTGTGAGHLLVSQWNALVTGGTTLDSANDITLSDTGANLGSETATDIAAMAGQIDHWESNDGTTVVASKALLDALATASIDFTPNNYVVLFSDTEATVEGLTATQLQDYITEGVTAFRASDTSTLNLDVSQVTAVVDHAAYFVPANTVTLVDSAANIQALTATQFGELVTGFVDVITATAGPLSVDVAQFEAVKTALHNGDLTLTNSAELSDDGTAISALTTTEIGQLSGDNIGTIVGTGDIDFTQAQISALGGVGVSATGNFVLADTGATIGSLTTNEINTLATVGIGMFDATDNALTLSVAQFNQIVADSITLTAGDTVTISDTADNLSGLNFAALAGANVDVLDSTDAYTALTVTQMTALGAVHFSAASSVTLTDTAAHIQAVSDFSTFAAHGVDTIDSTDNTLDLDVDQFDGLGATQLTGSDIVAITDTAAAISGVFDALNADTQIDKIIVTDSASHKVAITMAQAANDTTALNELYQSDGTTPAGVDVVDAPPPTTVVSTVAFSADTGAGSSDFITNIAAQTISGTLSANLAVGETVEVSLDNGATWTTATASVGSNIFSLAGQTLMASDTLQARVTDFNGTSSPASQAYVLDTVAPGQPEEMALASGSDSATLGDDITNVTTPTVTGAAEDGSTVTLYDTDGTTVLGTGTATGGTYSIVASALTEGGHTLSVKAMDTAGNVSVASSGLDVTIDTTAPGQPTTPALASGSDSGTLGDGITSVTTPTVTGTAEDGTTVTLYDTDGTTVLGTGIATGGTYSIETSALTEGSHTLSVKAMDTAGNVSVASSGLAVTIDTTAPGQPEAPALASGSDSGVPGDGITTITTPTITGTAEDGATVTLYDTNGTTVLGIGVAIGGTYSITTSAVGEGGHTLSVTAIDAAGNVSVASSGLAVTIDTVAPGQPDQPALGSGSDSGTQGDGITNVTTPTVIGFAEDGTTVTLYDTDGTTVLGTGVATDGIYDVTSSALAEGGHTVSVIATDTAGNVSVASSGFTVTIDTAAPGQPATPALASGSDSGTPGNGITNIATPAFTGTVEAGSTVTLYDTDGTTVLGTATADGDGIYSIASSALTDGSHTLSVTATDAAGNTSGASSGVDLTIDTTAPATPTVGTIVAHGDHFDVSGASDTGTSVTISDSNGAVASFSTNAGSFGAYDATSASALADGTHVLTATASDAAGNTATSTAADVVVDTASGIAFSDASFTIGEDSALTHLVLDGGGLTGTGNSHGSVIYSAENFASDVNTLIGGIGADFLSGGTGADSLRGGDGNDLYVVHSSGTTISDSGGTLDIAYVEGVDFALTDGDGVDDAILENGTGHTLTGHATEASTLYSVDTADQSNTVAGGSGADILVGGLGSDHLAGGDGSDTYLVYSAGTTITDTGGATDVVYAEGVNWSLSDGDGIEVLVVQGTGLTGAGHGTEATMLYSVDTADQSNALFGGSGADLLVGGAGSDSLQGGGGDDVYVVNSADTTVSDAGGTLDAIYAEGVNFSLTDGDGIEALILEGSGHTATGHATTTSTIYSTGGDNMLIGGTADDILVAGPGGDTLIGGAGNDSLVAGAGNDTFQFDAGSGADIVYNFHPHDGGSNQDTIRLTGEPAGTTFAGMVTNGQIFESADSSQSSGADVFVVQDANNFAVLLNHHVADLSASDFLFS